MQTDLIKQVLKEVEEMMTVPTEEQKRRIKKMTNRIPREYRYNALKTHLDN